MEAIKISLDNYVLSGGGANGESYDCISDPSVMLKLYFPGKIQQPLDELLLSRKVWDLDIPTPEPGDYVVTEDGRYGIRFRRITGKKSFARATGDDPAMAPEYGARFAGMCKKLHSTHVPEGLFENVKDRYYRLLDENPFFTPSEKNKIGDFIASVPDKDTAIHGDLQFGNAIFTDTHEYFIDLGDFCFGNPLFDLGMVYLTCNLEGDDFLKEAFHMDQPEAHAFWEGFVPEYFGESKSLSDVNELILPFAGLKTLIIERDTKMPMKEFRAALSSIL